VPGALGAARTQVGRVVLHTLLANSAQWFDLLVFVVLGGQLAAAMAPRQLTQHQQLGLVFVIFAAGHVLWLAGCFVWPWLTARLGRRTVLAWTVGLSAFPTALLGCMPTYAEVRQRQ
jgi:MHS family proline/betaine transporter-like MFS transporter